MTEVALQRKTA